MSNDKRLVLTKVSLSPGGVHAATGMSLSMDIAGATAIAHSELNTIDIIYPNLRLVDMLAWEEVSYAHTLLCSNGKNYLILVSETDIFNNQKAIVFEISSYPDTEVNISEIFSYILRDRISNGRTAIYQNDLEWL
jgi:hypothetical protein